MHVDPRHPRRHRHRDLVGWRRYRAGDDAVLERSRDRRHRQAERTGGIGRHVADAPAIAVRDLHLRENRRAVSHELRLNRQRRARLDPRVPRRHVQPDAIGKQRQRRRVHRLARRSAGEEQDRPEHEHGCGGLESGATQRFSRHNRVDVDARHPTCGVGNHHVGKGRPTLRLRHVDSGDETIAERLGALLDVARDLFVTGHPAQRQQAPGQRGGGERCGRRGQRHQRDGSAFGPSRDEQGHADNRRGDECTAHDGVQRDERPPPRADAIDDPADFTVVLHSYPVLAARTPSAASSTAIAASAYRQRCCWSSCSRASPRVAVAPWSLSRVTAD